LDDPIVDDDGLEEANEEDFTEHTGLTDTDEGEADVAENEHTCLSDTDKSEAESKGTAAQIGTRCRRYVDEFSDDEETIAQAAASSVEAAMPMAGGGDDSVIGPNRLLNEMIV
jgi:hypothetical protein